MTSPTSPVRRRLRVAGNIGALLVALVVAGVAYTVLAPSGQAASGGNANAVTSGRRLFLTSCSSCHGLQAQGTSVAPSLIGVGPAAVDFQVGSGRMPLQAQDQEAYRKPPRFDQSEIAALAAYIGSLAPGPQIPSASDLNLNLGNVAQGGELFRTNCAQCHNFNGSGGALTYGKYAPSLYPASPKQIWEAMLTGPENMPVFSDRQLTPNQKRDIVTFLVRTHNQADPGGLNLGRIGPVSEGLVAWLIGIGACVVATVWIGVRL